MNKTATIISQGCLQDLYLQKSLLKNHIFVQILAFQQSQYNPKQIILRISDKYSFIDCLLVGPYIINNNQIISTGFSHSTQSFKTFDIIKITDFFCKIDSSKICQLRIIVRKIQESSSTGLIYGRPEEISQYIQNNNLFGRKTITAQFQTTNNTNNGSFDTPIKIQQNAQETYIHSNNDKNIQKTTNSIQKQQQQSLTLSDIMNNKQGYFVGRLVRIKTGAKQSKGGPMSFLYLGFLDINGDLVRIHLAGRTSIKQSRELKKGKVYYIKGLQLYTGEKTKTSPQIRLKEKDYKIQQISNQTITCQYKHQYYKWQHQNQTTQSQMVDIIGIVEQIEDKMTYKNSNTYQQQREVVRLIIRNAFKTSRISFWADHISILNNLRLKKRQAIIIEDIKKKKSIFLDYISESNIIILDQNMKQQFMELLPPSVEAPQPTNIKQLLEVIQMQPNSVKMRNLTITLIGINIKWIIYKMCVDCKKKVQKTLEKCHECGKQTFTYRYNCPLQISDSSSSTSCVSFDGPCQKLFNRNANELSRLSQAQLKQIIQSLINRTYKITLQHKNNRLIIRHLELIEAIVKINHYDHEKIDEQQMIAH